MANRQIAGLTAEGSLDTTFVIPVQKADGSVEAKKSTLAEVKTVFGITEPIEKVVKISLTSADILDIFTTPIEVVPAVTGKLLVPRFIHQKYTHVTTPYTGGATWRIGLGSVNTAFAVVSAVIGSADNSEAIQVLSQSWSASGSSYENLNIMIGAASANPTGGDGTLELFITYIEIDIT